MRTGAVIQARTSSTRLPGKVLLEMPPGSGVSVLRRVIDRVSAATSLDVVIVATSDRLDDDLVADLASDAGVSCYRGPLEDVLARYVGAASEHALERIVRVTADCPCVDPEIIDAIVELQDSTGADFCTNVVPRTWAKGLDVELVTAKALARIDAGAVTLTDREHVFTYAYETAPGEFCVANLQAPPPLRGPELRATLDTAEDYQLLCAVYERLGPDFATFELMGLLRELAEESTGFHHDE